MFKKSIKSLILFLFFIVFFQKQNCIQVYAVDFGTPIQFNLTQNIYFMAIGDFNGDGKSDIVTANSGSDSVSVLLGNGDGTFTSSVDCGVGTMPSSVTVGDFNGDGELDIVTANSGSDSVSVLLGNGDGTFGPSANYGVGTNPSSVAVGDFNRDGKLDIVAANSGSNSVSVLRGNGDGTFGPGFNYGVGTNPNSVAVGDFNGDGELDIVTANSGSNSISVLLGNGDGTFGPSFNYGVGTNPDSVAVGDFNGDGKLDIVTVNSGSDNVSVLRGNEDGTFGASANYGVGTNPSSVTVGDFNGDGKLDIVTVNSGSDNVSVLRGNGDGTFGASANYDVGTNPSSMAVGDFNGDGSLDFIVGNGASNFSTYINSRATAAALPSKLGSRNARLDAEINNNCTDAAISFEYGTSISYGSTAPSVTSNSTSAYAEISNLTNSTQYHYRVKVEKGGITTCGRDQTFTTAAEPTINIPSSSNTSFNEGDSAVPIANDLTVTSTNTNYLSATVSITDNFKASEDNLNFTNDAITMGDIAGSYDAAKGILTLTSASGNPSANEWQAALRSVTYNNISENPATSTRTITFAVNDGNVSSNATKLVDVTAVNDVPTITAPVSQSITMDGANSITGISFDDVDAGSSTVTATFSVTSGNFAAVSGGGVTVVGSGSTSLTLTGTITNINSFIAASGVNFTNAAGNTSNITLSVEINDSGNTGSGGAKTAFSTVTLPILNPPTVISVAVPADKTYKVGENLDFTVKFNKSVVVIGTPQLPITIGGASKFASYIPGSGSTDLVFRYTVETGDNDSDGITVGTALALNTGTIKDSSDNNALLTLNSVGTTSGVKVDATPQVTTEITSFDAISNVSAGNAGSATYANAAAVIAALPTIVKANNNAVSIPVSTWVNTDNYNPNAAGSYTFTATLGTIPAGYANSGNYTATVEVVVGTPYIPPYVPPAPQPTTETRQVPVEVGNGGQQGTTVQTIVIRTTDTSGVKTDTVKFDENTASEAIKKASETKSTGAVIDISDTSGNSADNTEFQLPAASMSEFANKNMSLSLKTEKAALEIPTGTIEELSGQDAAVKISEEKDSSKIENNKALVLKVASGSDIISAPLNIEANYTGRTKISIPIDSSKLPSSKEELDKFLSSLAVMVHHSDGEDVVDKGTIVYDEKGKVTGIAIWVDKFSSFTLIEIPEDYFQGKTTVIQDKVAADKEWNIKFTKAADAATVTKDNVYVVDSKGNKVDVKVSYGSDNILKVAPVNPYTSGETYYLYITKAVKAKDKTPLVNELRYQFIIK